jgi:haloalkane dehalogenase
MANGESILSLVSRIADLLEKRAVALPPKAPQEVAPPSDAYPFLPNFVKSYGANMHYVDVGPKDADPILFLHGNPSWSYLWRNIIPALQPFARCIAVDLMGFGLSDKPQSEYRFFDQARYLEGFIQQLGLRNITMVLHDWGSGLGFHYAMQNEDNIKGLAFMEAMLKPYPDWAHFPREGADPNFVGLFRSFRGKPHEDGWKFLVDSPDNWLKFLLLGPMGRPLSQTEIGYYSKPFPDAPSRVPIWRFPNELPVEDDPPDTNDAVQRYSDRLRRSAIPKLLLYTKLGVILNMPEKEWAEAHLTDLKVVELADAGPQVPVHFVQERYPQQICAALTDWYGAYRPGGGYGRCPTLTMS